MNSKLTPWLFFLLLSAADLPAQVDVSARLDTNRILIGDQVELSLVVKHPAGLRVLGADYSGLARGEEVEALRVNPWDTLSRGDQFLLEQRLLLTSFDSGYHFLGPFEVRYLRGGVEATVASPQLALEVLTIPSRGDTTQLMPIKPIIEEPLKLWDVLPYAAGLLALAAIIIGVVWWLRRRRRKGQPPPPEVIRPAHEIALEQLDELKRARLWQQGQTKAFQSELTHVLREYLENRYRIPALESTTDEIARQIRPLDFPEDWKEKLTELFRTADMVKFAKAQPPVEVHSRGQQEAEAFVLATKEAPPPVAGVQAEEEE